MHVAGQKCATPRSPWVCHGIVTDFLWKLPHKKAIMLSIGDGFADE
jgi:hypothetical protein